MPNLPIHPRRFQRGPVLLCVLAATALALTISCISPPLYQSSARLEFRQDPPGMALELLRSQGLLQKAGIRPSRVRIRPVPGTAEADITVLDENPQRAASLANGIAQVYNQTRTQVARGDRPQQLAALESSLASVSAEFEGVKHDYDSVTQSLAQAQSAFGDSPDGPWRRQPELDANLAETTKLQEQLDALSKAQFPEFLHVANRFKLINSDRMTWVAEYLGTMNTLQAQTQAGLPANGPEVTRARKRVADLRLQLEKDAADLTASMALQIQALQQRAVALGTERDAARARLVEVLAANKVATEAFHTAQESLRQTRAQVESVRTLDAVTPEFIRTVKTATAVNRPAQPGFWLPLLLSPIIGLTGGMLLQILRWFRNGQNRALAA